MSIINNLIQALLEIRLKLTIKKMVSPTISRNDLEATIEETKANSDNEVKKEIDNVFSEYFEPKALESPASEMFKDEDNTKDSVLSLNAMVNRDAA